MMFFHALSQRLKYVVVVTNGAGCRTETVKKYQIINSQNGNFCYIRYQEPIVIAKPAMLMGLLSTGHDTFDPPTTALAGNFMGGRGIQKGTRLR
jgi:hypothetical protein